MTKIQIKCIILRNSTFDEVFERVEGNTSMNASIAMGQNSLNQYNITY